MLSNSFSHFKLHAILLRASSYCHVHNVNQYIIKVGGYKYELTKINDNPEMCTFEDIIFQSREEPKVDNISGVCHRLLL